MATSSKNVKFEISIEKLVVKFEGDVQVAERLHGDISSALNTLTSAQSKLLLAGKPAPATAAAAGNADVRGTGRRRRRKRGGGATEGIDASILEGQLDASNESGSNGADSSGNGASSRRDSAGAGALLGTLKSEGFFKEQRTLGAIREKMAAKGHNFGSNEISPSLVRATQNGVLQRVKRQNQWVYSE